MELASKRTTTTREPRPGQGGGSDQRLRSAGTGIRALSIELRRNQEPAHQARVSWGFRPRALRPCLLAGRGTCAPSMSGSGALAISKGARKPRASASQSGPNVATHETVADIGRNLILLELLLFSVAWRRDGEGTAALADRPGTFRSACARPSSARGPFLLASTPRSREGCSCPATTHGRHGRVTAEQRTP